MIDFSISPELAELAARTRRFVIDEIIPHERDPRLTQHGPTDELRQELVEKARKAGLLSIQVAKKFGGISNGNILRAPYALLCPRGRCGLFNRTRSGAAGRTKR